MVRINGAVAFALVAVLALAMSGAASALVQDDHASGKVTAYEAGKSITVEVGKEKKEFKIGADTKIEGEVAVGKDVEVTAKDGTATKIVEKKKM